MKPVYKANDDSEHKTAAKAAAHNKLIAARRKAQEAIDELHKVAAKSTLTADGVPFSLEHREYFRVINHYGWTGPSVACVRLWYNVSFDEDRRDGIVIREYDTQRREYISHPISELYATQDAAKKACIAAAEERLEDIRKQVEEMKVGKIHVAY